MSNAISHITQENQEFKINIQGKNVEVTNSMRDYVLEKTEKIEHLSSGLIDMHVRFDVYKPNYECQIILNFMHTTVKVHAVTEDLYSAIDKAFDRLKAKVKKWKSRLQDHHAKGVKMTEMEVQIFEHKGDGDRARDEEIMDQNNDNIPIDFTLPEIKTVKRRQLKTLTIDEALMKIDLSGDHFLVFKSEEEQNIKVLYRREDGGYGLMTPTS